MTFRYGIDLLIQSCKNFDLHVLSAGIIGVISIMFDKLSIIHEKPELMRKIKIFGTEEKYDADRCLIGFGSLILTPFNKFDLFTYANFPELSKFRNAIVLGDLPEDILAVKNLTKLETILSIGFDGNSKETEEEMKNKYDILIKNDGNLLLIIEIIQFVQSTESETIQDFDYLSKLLYK